MKQNKSRRQFLKDMFGGFGIVMVSRVSWLFPEAEIPLSQTKQEFTQTTKMIEEEYGELYEGFLILPNVDSPAISPEGSALTERQITEFVNIQEALNRTDIPLYLPSTLPNGVELSKVSLQTYESATTPHLVTISYSLAGTGIHGTDLSISASMDFPRPFPVHPVHMFQNRDSQPQLVFPDRVTFSPTPGIMLPSVIGYGLHWIEGDVLYSIIQEYSTDRDEIVKFVSSLEKHI